MGTGGDWIGAKQRRMEGGRHAGRGGREGEAGRGKVRRQEERGDKEMEQGDQAGRG